MTIRIEGYDLNDFYDVDVRGWSQQHVVRMLNGQVVELTPGKSTYIPASEGNSAFNLNLDFVERSTPLSKVTFNIIASTLRTYSQDYSRAISRTIRAAFLTNVFDLDRPITLQHVEKWSSKTLVSYWPFLKFYLYQLSRFPSQAFISDEVRAFLDAPEQFEERAGGAYFTLLTNDPLRGALTEQELKNIQTALNQAYSRGEISFLAYAFTWTLIATGIRPIQLARMTFGDVIIQDGPAGRGREVMLMIPLAKGFRAPTSERWARRAPSVLADVLTRYVRLKAHASQSAPLFFAKGSTVSQELTNVFSKLETYSTRTGGPIHITPYRFRYTLGTRAIAHGASDAQVARLLTHRTTQSVASYRAAMAMVQAPIEDAIGDDMDLFADVFSGRIINDFDDATHSDDVRKLIRDFERLSGQKIGACGLSAECFQNAPRACLTCIFFEPLLDAPWQQLEEEIHRDIAKETETRIIQIGKDQLSGLQLIKTACDAKRRELLESNS